MDDNFGFTDEEIEIMVLGDDTYAVDGCGPIEPDGHCSHGSPSVLLAMGII